MRFDQILGWYRRRWLDVVVSIYVYNEHRGYTALDELLMAMRADRRMDPSFIADIERHRADEHKHYLMFKRWFEKQRQMPLFVDRTCGHIDRFIEIMFGARIDRIDTPLMVRDERNFEKLCRVVALTERRGYRQVQTLLRHPFVRRERHLTKIFEVIRADEPRHWAPYESWLKRHQRREPAWWERWIDAVIHSELLLIKLPLLFLAPWVRRRSDWPDEDEARAARRTVAVAAR
jgi:rubrerythrin